MPIPIAVAAVAAGAAVVGSMIKAKGQRDSANAQAAAARAAGDAKKVQAKEILRRTKINVKRLREQGLGLQARQAAAFAASGVGGSTTTTLSMMNDTMNSIETQIKDMNMDAQFKARQLKKGASIDTTSAGQIAAAGRTAAVGSLIGGAGSAAMSFAGR